MNKKWTALWIIALMVLGSCSDEITEIQPPVQNAEMTKFGFLKIQ